MARGTVHPSPPPRRAEPLLDALSSQAASPPRAHAPLSFSLSLTTCQHMPPCCLCGSSTPAPVVSRRTRLGLISRHQSILHAIMHPAPCTLHPPPAGAAAAPRAAAPRTAIAQQSGAAPLRAALGKDNLHTRNLRQHVLEVRLRLGVAPVFRRNTRVGAAQRKRRGTRVGGGSVQ